MAGLLNAFEGLLLIFSPRLYSGKSGASQNKTTVVKYGRQKSLTFSSLADLKERGGRERYLSLLFYYF